MLKIQDNFSDYKSKHDLYNNESNLIKLFKLFKGTSSFPSKWYKEGKLVVNTTKSFGLRGLQFGEWLTTEDKYNYTLALYSALFDLNKILLFKNKDIGMRGMLGISIGSRGIPNAYAHYETNQYIINLSRYHRKDRLPYKQKKECEAMGSSECKKWRFLYTGGPGSLAHEYGHFLDNFIATKIEPKRGSVYLTGNPGSIRAGREKINEDKYPIHHIMEEIMYNVIFNERGLTSYYQRIRKHNPYYYKRVEIWARLFEQYIAYKMKQRGMKNHFLTSPKYSSPVYMNKSELERIVPYIDRLLFEVRDKLKRFFY